MPLRRPTNTAPDDQPLIITRRDYSGGQNTRLHSTHIGENQAEVLDNVDIGVPGQRRKRPGLVDLKTDFGEACHGIFGFEPDGGTNELLVLEDTDLHGCTDFAAENFTAHDTGFTDAVAPVSMIKVWKSGGDGHVVMIQNGTDNAHEMKQDHTVTDLTDDNDDPPKSLVNLFAMSRWWVLKDNALYWSDALPSNYAGAFDRVTNHFNVPVGTQRGLVYTREMGIICFGADAVGRMMPSVVPVATDKYERMLDIGCSANKTICQVGDDVWFLAPDGVRGLFRTIQDKVQLGQSYPLSYLRRSNFADINWSQISLACAVYFDNKYFLSVPTGTSTYNDTVWVFYPSLLVNAGNNVVVPASVRITGWNVAGWAKIKVSNEERLYAIDGNTGACYRAWSGYDDSGTAINYLEQGRDEDMGLPHLWKWGGELEVKAQGVGDYDLSVSIEFDGDGYNSLGSLNLTGGGVTFSTTFPVTFGDVEVSDKFPLWSYDKWKKAQVKLQHNASNGTDDITVLEHTLVTYPEPYKGD